VAGQTPTASVSTRQPTWPEVPTSQVFVFVTVAASAVLALLVLTVPLELADGLATAMATLMAMGTVFILTPPLIRKMQAGGMVGLDVNKLARRPIAELGGISALFAFSVSLSLVVGFQKLLGNVAEPPFLAAISVFFMAATIGLIDDISDLPQRLKAVAVAFAALPLMLVHLGAPAITFPFGYQWTFLGEWHLFYWLILVPIGVTGVANAMNMSAGYNGLETGQIAVASAALLIVGQLRGAPDVALLVFGSILGCSVGLYYFNRYPARIFIGDIGTLGLGAALAAGVILAHLEFYGLIAITPAFFEAGATAYYGFRKQNEARKIACRNPRMEPDGTLQPPPGAEHYTLAYWLLSRRPLTERSLVKVLLLIYAMAGVVAILLSLW
jgi:UDP-N-acetylglucosamine--dolichyl-phosphate N-acetylglucosaminephosphotransferase